MKTHSHFSHTLALAMPLFMLIGFVVAVGIFGLSVFDPIVMDDPDAGLLVATIGAGIDEFSMRAADMLEPFIPTDLGGWVLALAIFVTLWSVIKVIREMRGPVGGARDSGALVGHVVRQAHILIGIRAPSVAWGIVRDAATGHPLPLATVRLVGADGTVLDSCVADQIGRYGFRLSYVAAVQRGYQANIEARKSGHYFPPAGGRGIEHRAGGIDIMMDCVHEGRHGAAPANSRLWRWSGAVAFWIGVVLIPLVFLQESDFSRSLMFAMFIGVSIIRATWHSPENR